MVLEVKEAGISPEELYTRSDAEYAIKSADKVFLLVTKLFNEARRIEK